MKKIYAVVMVILLAVGFGAGIWTGLFIKGNNGNTAVVSGNGSAEFKLVEDAWNITRANYVDTNATQPKTLAYGTIAGMINSLGDTGHSTFLTPQEVQRADTFEQGELHGIGVEVQWKNGSMVIMAPLSGTPAEKAGLVSGDIIEKVNGQTLTSLTQGVGLIMGKVGTSVNLTILQPDGTTRVVSVVRAVIKVNSVSWHEVPGTTIADLRLSDFAKGTTSQLDTALAQIKAQGCTSIILDLRDNPGGLLQDAVDVTSRFIKSGNVLLEKDIKGKITPVPVAQGATVTDLPMVVLVNQGTASAAEITAGALQSHGRAKLIGETTFGTGTVLNQFPLPDGSALILAVQEWLTPAGKTIWHVGLTPDDVVAMPKTGTLLVPDELQSMTAAQLQSSGDAQLLAGMKMLGATP